MTDTMRAVVLDAPGPVQNLHIRDLPIPEPRPGWVRIRVMAFGLNRSELHTSSATPRASRSPGCSGSRQSAWSTPTRTAAWHQVSRSPP